MQLKPIICVLHALIISYHLCFLPNIVHAIETHIMRVACPKNIPLSKPSAKFLLAFEPKLCVLHALAISYNLCFLPNILHAFHSHNSRATCPNNNLSSVHCA